MLKKWLLATILLFGASSGAWAGQLPPHRVGSGETLSSIGKQFGYDWRVLCAFNGLANCNDIKVDALIRFPEHGALQVVAKKQAVSLVTEPGVFRWTKVGGAPLYGCGNREEGAINEEAWRTIGLTEEEQSEVRWLVAFKQHRDQFFHPGDRFEAVAFCKAGHVAFERNVLAAWQEDTVVLARTYVLKSGRVLHWVRNCNNWVVGIPLPPVAPLAPPAPPLPQEEPSAQQLPVSSPGPDFQEPSEVEKVARDYDWDLGFFIGGDKDGHYAGGEGAGYPFIRYADWGRYALGGGGSFSLWNGGTPDGYRYSGETAAFGLAQKFSFNSRRDVGIKFPMIGGLWESGHDASGKYQQNRFASLWCASASYTDASREKEGEKWVPEWQLWMSLCDPISQAKSHSWEGNALDPSAIPDTKYILGVGGRVFLSKNLGEGWLKKVQPFAEVGLNKTSPNPWSGHAYIGLRTVDKVWGLGVGLHFADIGNTLGATLTYDAGRHYKLHVQEERWNAMIRSLEALGVAVD